MRARNAVTASAFAIATLAWSGCDAKKQTEYVAGVSTQITVPRDIASIVVSVSVGGVNQFCRAYRAYNGTVQLPRSLGEFPASGTPGADPITVAVIGLSEEATDQSSNAYVSDCSFTQQKVGENSARILRRSRQPYVPEKVLFLPMPLRYSCADKDCPNEDQTCKAGRCVSVDTDPKFLPAYRDDLIDGSGGACFSATQCFAAAVPPVLVDPNDCTYALPNTASAPAPLPGAPTNPITSSGEGINVEITYDSGLTTEILDNDADEGFFVPDPSKPQRFRLTPGLCDLVKGIDQDGNATPHQITSIKATGLCQAKGKFQPLCTDDQNIAMGTPGGVSPAPTVNQCVSTKLTPSKSVLLILADDTLNNRIFYDGSGGGAGDIVESQLVSVALADPAFKSTFLGLTFFPGQSAIGTCTPHPAAVEPKIAAQARDAIANEFDKRKTDVGLAPENTELRMSGALLDAYARLRQADVADANRRAVFIIGNRSFDTNICGGTPADVAKAAYMSADKINTYVGVLARDATVTPIPATPPPLPGKDELAAAGADPAAMQIAYDSRDNPSIAQNALRKIVNELGTCAYDVTTVGNDATPPDNSYVLAYSDPIAVGPATPHKILHNASCTTNGGAGDGWGSVTISTKAATPTTPKSVLTRFFVCGQSCTDYRTTLMNAAAYNAIYGQQSPDIPLFAYKPECAPR